MRDKYDWKASRWRRRAPFTELNRDNPKTAAKVPKPTCQADWLNRFYNDQCTLKDVLDSGHFSKEEWLALIDEHLGT